MTKENQLNQRFKACSRWEQCSINVCPLDEDVELRTKLKSENACPFTINRKQRSQKGIRTLARDGILKVIPKTSSKMLNTRNLKRWCTLYYLSNNE